MTMNKAARLVDIKAGPTDGLAEGEFTAYASVFGNIDSYGDKVIEGAFKASLTEWDQSDNVIPLLYGHNMTDPDFNIGSITEAKEDDHGLLVQGVLDLEGPKAQQVYRLLKGRRLSQLSFAYDVVEGAWVDMKDEPSFYELRELKLYEVSLVPIGANQETELLAVKAASEHTIRWVAEVKAGRVLSAKNEDTLRKAHDDLTVAAQQIADVLSAVESTTEDQEKATQSTQPAKDEEPAGAKSEEPTAIGPDDTLRLITIRQREAVSR